MAGFRPSALFVPDLKQWVAEKDYRELKRALAEINPIDLADAFESFTAMEKLVVFKLLPSSRALDVFEELESRDQAFLLSTLELGTLGPALEGLDQDEARSLFHRLPDRLVRRMIGLARRGRREGLAPPSDFPPTTAGGLMHTDVLELLPTHTAQQALEIVRGASRLHRVEDLNVLYVTDPQGRLLGVISPRVLIAAPREMKLANLMSPVQLFKIRADTDQEEAAKVFQKYKILAAPVVDAENRLLGVLSGSDILSVVSQEATEDIAKMAGTEAEELETASLTRVVRLRMPWLLASWVGGIAVSFIIGRFEHILTSVVALAAFMPVIAGMGGNVGTQSSSIVVRGLATGDIRMGDIARIMGRELQVGLLLGIGYGLLLAAVAAARFGGAYSWNFPVVVGLGICTSMTVAALMGAMTPMIVRRIGIDPAVCSAPFVSTATDILSLLTYFSVATWLLI